MMTASVCIVALNEERYLGRLLRDIESQTYPHELIEILLIDSLSTDGTKRIMQEFSETDKSFSSVKFFDNSDRIQAAGWNLAIANATGDVIIRLDAHTRISADFIEKNMAHQERGEYVTGGVRPCIMDEPTPWRKTLLEAENSLFGSSVSKGRRGKRSGYVKSMFNAAYRREVFERAGVFNTSLLRTEDNEMHYRIRKAGYKLYCDPEIVSRQYARGNLCDIIKQKYGNGYWIGVTLGICPGCVSLFHLVPLAFLLGIIGTSALAIFGLWHLSAIMWIAYGIFVLSGTIVTVISGKANGFTPLMPFLLSTMHLSYGIGTLFGILCIPFCKIKRK